MTWDEAAVSGGVVAIIAMGIASVAAWLTHVVVTITYIASGIESVAYGLLLVVGVFVPPVGVIHGVGVWFGAW